MNAGEFRTYAHSTMRANCFRLKRGTRENASRSGAGAGMFLRDAARAKEN